MSALGQHSLLCDQFWDRGSTYCAVRSRPGQLAPPDGSNWLDSGQSCLYIGGRLLGMPHLVMLLQMDNAQGKICGPRELQRASARCRRPSDKAGNLIRCRLRACFPSEFTDSVARHDKYVQKQQGYDLPTQRVGVGR